MRLIPTFHNRESFKAFLDTCLKGDHRVTWEINPMMAEVMLEHNTGNRPLSDKRIALMAKEMNEGKWMLTGENIIFAKDGTLNNGQHRLNAQIIAERTFISDVRFGIEREAYKVTDLGKKRTQADALSILGEKRCTTLAAALAWVHRFQQGLPESARDTCDTTTTVKLLQEHPDIRESVVKAMQMVRSFPGFQGGPMAFGHYAMAQRHGDAADAFFLKLETGFGISDRDDPIYRLRQRMTQVLNSRTELRPVDQLALSFKAWNAYRQNKPLSQLSWRSEGTQAEPFPEPI